MAKVFQDKVNIRNAQIVADNFDDFAKDSWTDDDKEQQLKLLTALINNTDRQTGLCKTGYKFGKNRNSGRLFVKNGIGIQIQSRMIRNTIADDDYIDIDIVNCFPTLLLNYCKEKDYPCKALGLYVKHRNKYIREIGDSFDLKRVMFELLNNGRKTYDSIDTKPNWIIEIKNNIEIIIECLIRDNAERYKAIHKKNARGTLMFETLECIECDILESMITFCKEQMGVNIKNIVKMYDGFMIPRSAFTNEHLDKLNTYVNETFNVSIIQKPLQKHNLTGYEYVEPPAENDYACAINFMNFMKELGHDFIRNGKEIYWFNIDMGIWIVDLMEIRPYINRCDTIADPWRTGSKKQDNLITQFKSQIENDKEINNRIFECTYGFIPFNNGVYSFKDKKLYDFDKKYFFTSKLKCDYDPMFDMSMEQEIKQKLIYDIFGDSDIQKETGEYFLKIVARAIAGEINDKSFFIVVGDTNSGKGCLSDIIAKCFSGFTGTFNANQLSVNKNGGGDQAKNLSWVYDIREKKIVIANEWSMEKLTDANLLKTICSGDDMCARANYINEQTFKPCSTFFVFANDIPKINSAEESVLNRVKYMKTEYSYLTGTKYEKRKNESNVKKGDNTIKDVFIKDPKIIQTFMYMILNAYQNEKPIEPQGVIDETNEWEEDGDMSAEILDLFVDDPNDFIPLADFKKYVIDTKHIKISPRKISSIMTKNGYKPANKHNNKVSPPKVVKCYVGIKWRNDYNTMQDLDDNL